MSRHRSHRTETLPKFIDQGFFSAYGLEEEVEEKHVWMFFHTEYNS